MADLHAIDLDAALARGTRARMSEPRAVAVRYDVAAGHIVLQLANECIFSFPARLGQGLEGATNDQLAAVELLGDGYGLHWEDLDVDLSVPGVTAGLLGTRSHMARLAGRATSPAKADAARANGAKGGRPRRAR